MLMYRVLLREGPGLADELMEDEQQTTPYARLWLAEELEDMG